MATSPLFGWEEPDDVDLVKDGAAAIRTLGNAIDTSMGDLLGGTTGQVLSKASNTNMDFTWVAQDDSNAIQNSIVNAKGDLIAASANDVPAIISVGANGETLVADSSTSTGLSYQANWSAGRNKFLNSNFAIWQRGTSQTTQGFGSADRWNVLCDGSFTNSQQTFTPGTAPVAGYEGQYFYRSARTTGSYMIVQQNIENVQTFAGQTVTLSYWAKCSSGTITNEPTAFQYFGSGGSSNVDIGCTPSTATVTTTWTRFSHTFTIPSISGKTLGSGSYLSFRPLRHVSATGATIDIWGLQVEASSVATAFQTATGTIQGELAACQRYYYRQGGDSAYSNFGTGSGNGSTSANFWIRPPVTMRVRPTSVDYSALSIYDNVSIIAVTSLPIDASLSSRDALNIAGVTAGGVTQFRPYTLMSNNNTSGFLALNAEL